LKDLNFKPKFEQSAEVKNAFFKILSTRAHKWLKTKKIELPESFKELTQNILNSNDHIQDFVDGVLVKSDNNENDRIGKQDMLKYYSAMYPNKHLQSLQLQMLLKERGIKYNRQFSSVCFYGVKLKTDDDNDTDEDYENGVEKTNQSVDVTNLLKQENEELKKQIEQLKAQLENMQNKPQEEQPKKISKEYQNLFNVVKKEESDKLLTPSQGEVAMHPTKNYQIKVNLPPPTNKRQHARSGWWLVRCGRAVRSAQCV
jgi:hypothetical protein